MRTRPRSIFPAVIRLILLLAGICYFAPEGAAGQANIAHCLRPHAGSGNPCSGPGPFTLRGPEPTLNLGAGNPVNLATGNKFQEAVDVPLQDDGLLFVRSYNAMDPIDTGLGPGWRHSFDIALQRNHDGLHITQADGSRLSFKPRNGKTAQAIDPAHGRLQVIPAGWIWHWPGGNSLAFDRDGRINALSVGGRHLQVRRYHRASIFAGHIRTVTSHDGRVMVFHYRQDPQGRIRLARIQAPTGSVQYSYDPIGARLNTVLTDNGNQTHYLYEPAYQQGRSWQLTGLAVSVSDAQATAQPSLRLRTWQYDSKGRVSRALRHDLPIGPGTLLFQYMPGSGNGHKGKTRVVDADGHSTTFGWRQWQDRYLLESVTGFGCVDCPAPGLLASYDHKGRLAAINGLRIDRYSSGAPAHLSLLHGFWPGLQLQYDPTGRLTSWFSALTDIQQIGYNNMGQPVSQQFADGVHWRYEYDHLQRLVRLHETVEPTPSRAAGPRRSTAATSASAAATVAAVATALTAHAEAPASTTTTTTLDYAPDGRVTLTHPNEKRVMTLNPANGSVRIEVSRKASARNPYAVNYRDVFQHDLRLRVVMHLLPEGGRLLYSYTVNHTLHSIIWEDAGQRRHQVIEMNAPGQAVFGNQIQVYSVRDAAGNQQLHYLAGISSEKRPILGLERRVAPDGRVRREVYYYPGLARALGRDYFYGRHQRIAGMVEQHYRYRKKQLMRTPRLVAKRRVWYAWGDSGASIARFDGKRTQRSHIVRDRSGLPLQVDSLQTRYGANRRLHRVYQQGRLIQHNLHNSLGHRIIRRDNEATTHFYYQDNRIAGEWIIPTGTPLAVPVDGAISRRYIYAGEVPVAFIEYHHPAPFIRKSLPGFNLAPLASVLHHAGANRSAGELYFIHTDTQGLPLAVTDGQAQTKWLALPEPAGKMTPLIARLRQPLRYPGQYHDEATGWADNLYRTYDPAFGHYLEPDPVGPLPGQDPLGYAAAQPRRYVDPLGLLLFAFDGTLNQGSKTSSNVYKLQQLYASGPVHYTGGPGTMDSMKALAEPAVYGASNPLSHPYVLGPLGLLLRPMDALTGDSVADIVRAQMHNLIDSLLGNAPSLKNDMGRVPIDIIGFSRGATAARIFANQLMRQTRNGLFSAQVYVPPGTQGQPIARTLTVNACLDFRFMGLFDTVAQLGVLGSDNAAFNYQVSPAWHWIAHAVALNEYNDLFPLTPIGLNPSDRIHEVGFMGNHSDIGGSIQASDARQVANPTGLPGDLGNVTLQWMHQQAQAAGVSLKPLPDTALRIRNPLVHNSLMHYKSQDPTHDTLALDRRLESRKGPARFQHQDGKLGRAARMQVERLINRDLPRTRPLTVPDLFYGSIMAVAPGREVQLVKQPIVGRADLLAYARWLRQTTGLQLQTDQVW